MNQYKKELIELFLFSVEKDIHNWIESKNNFNYYSPSYNNNQFNIDADGVFQKLYLYIFDPNTSNVKELKLIRIYNVIPTPLNLKIYKASKKIRRHFRKPIQDIYKDAADNIKNNFPQLIRKEKLEKINNL